MDTISHSSHSSSSSGTSRGTSMAADRQDRRDRRDRGYTGRQDKGRGKGRGKGQEDRAATGAAASMTIDLSKVRNAGGRREANMRMVGKRGRNGSVQCSAVQHCMWPPQEGDVLRVFPLNTSLVFPVFLYYRGLRGRETYGHTQTNLTSHPFFFFFFFFFSSDMSIKPVRNVYFI